MKNNTIQNIVVFSALLSLAVVMPYMGIPILIICLILKGDPELIRKEAEATKAENPETKTHAMTQAEIDAFNEQIFGSGHTAAASAPPRIPSQFSKDTKRFVENVIKKHYPNLKVAINWKDSDETYIDRKIAFEKKVKVGEKPRKAYICFDVTGVSRITLDGDEIMSREPKKPSSKKEKKQVPTQPNTFINEKGLEEVKPNFKMVAKDWINENLAYMNEVCNNALDPKGGTVKALLEASKLPKDRESWEAIGLSLIEQDEIDAFEVTADGLMVVID